MFRYDFIVMPKRGVDNFSTFAMSFQEVRADLLKNAQTVTLENDRLALDFSSAGGVLREAQPLNTKSRSLPVKTLRSM